MQSLQKKSVSIVWFKRDLRVAMNHALLQAAGSDWPVLPLYIVEPEYWSQPDVSHRHYQFISECLAELRDDLAAVGQPLILRVGAVRDVLEQLSKQVQIRQIFSHEETGNAWTFERDKAVQAWCRERGVPWTEAWQNGVVRRLKNRNGWARNWSRRMHAPLADGPLRLEPLSNLEPGPIPAARDLGLKEDGCTDRQRGGRWAGLKTLQSFLTRRGLHYRSKMSSPVTGFNACSRISPYLVFGALSLQEVAQATAKQRLVVKAKGERGDPWRGSLSSYEGRLHWHCHFMQKLESDPSLEFRALHPAYRDIRAESGTPHLLSAWQSGETGLPFVDACMRCLTATGWMNFRMRAMLVAVASYHFWLDWRVTGEYLARLFTDYEPGIHWSQMQMQSGTTGINTVRIYNPVKQGLDQDPDGIFIRRWVPELGRVPAGFLHQPWLWEGAESILGKTYPFPVIDHLEAAKSARQKIWDVRREPGYRDAANAIQIKHGSRRNGIKMTGGRQKAKPKAPTKQLTFDL